MNIWVEIFLALGLVVGIGFLWGFLQQLFGIEEKEKKEVERSLGVDSIGVAVVCFCHDGTGQYLVSKRSQLARDEKGAWEPGAGAVHFGERLEDAVRREMREEYGVTLQDLEYLGFRDSHRVLPDGRPTHWIVFDYRARIDPTQVVIGEPEHMEEFRWTSIADIPTPRHSQFGLFLEKYSGTL